MKCENCGSIIRRGNTYCPMCGMELRTEYKPLQERYKRGEFQDIDEDFYDERSVYQEPKTRTYQRGYNLDEYYPEEIEPESSGSILLPIILFLIAALLIGFIFGVIIFSSNFQAIPSIG